MTRFEQNEIINNVYDRAAAALRTDSVGSLQEVYEISGTTIYYGKAAMGFAESDEAWIIKKYSVTSTAGSGKTALGSWQDRTSLTYT